MATYKNDYTPEEDKMLWELHEIRQEVWADIEKFSFEELNKKAKEKFQSWKKDTDQAVKKAQ